MNTEKDAEQTKTPKSEIAEAEALENAITLVNAEVERVKNLLEKMAQEENTKPISVQGETHRGWPTMAQVASGHLAKILLKHNFQHCLVLKADAPEEMMSEIAEYAGLDCVEDIFLDL